jgi:hypothetical protein
MVGELDAGNPHVQFDEGVQETCDSATRLCPTLPQPLASHSPGSQANGPHYDTGRGRPKTLPDRIIGGLSGRKSRTTRPRPGLSPAIGSARRESHTQPLSIKILHAAPGGVPPTKKLPDRPCRPGALRFPHLKPIKRNSSCSRWCRRNCRTCSSFRCAS